MLDYKINNFVIDIDNSTISVMGPNKSLLNRMILAIF